jgi:uncharacterized integral membrane protein (TIGR00698 family)
VRRPQWIPLRSDLPGIALAAAIGASALGLLRVLPSSPFFSDVLLAIILGALVVNTGLRRLFGIANGLRYVGKWVLRLAIVLMGLKVQARFFGADEVLLIVGVACASIPGAFFVTHAIGARLGLRKPLVDLLAGGTMICGASAVNAIAPTVGARREEQGIAIGTVFLFSVVALVVFRPIAAAFQLDPADAGIWSGLAVNDLSSAIAVGGQMGGDAMAAASKSARILLMAPTLVAFAIARRGRGVRDDVAKNIVAQLPLYLVGYIALAAMRELGDRAFGAAGAWTALLAADRFAVDLTITTVSAAIGLHLDGRRLLASGPRAIATGGAASAWMAVVTLAMIVAATRGERGWALGIGAASLVVAFASFRAFASPEADLRTLEARLDRGEALSLDDATRLLDALDRTSRVGEPILRRVLMVLQPSIGELIPVRHSPLGHGQGCRWATYWEGGSGWALVAVCREPGSSTPIHAHSHRLIGKCIEGQIEELRFAERASGEFEMTARSVLAHNDLVETDGLATLHVVRVVGDRTAIDLQLRGPEVGRPGTRLKTREALDFTALVPGARVHATREVDDRPGQSGDGAAAGRLPA